MPPDYRIDYKTCKVTHVWIVRVYEMKKKTVKYRRDRYEAWDNYKQQWGRSTRLQRLASPTLRRATSECVGVSGSGCSFNTLFVSQRIVVVSQTIFNYLSALYVFILRYSSKSYYGFVLNGQAMINYWSERYLVLFNL